MPFVSDIVADSVELARRRLAKLHEADDIEAGGVDVVLATNVMHFPDPQDAAMATIARQPRPGGTFVADQFGPVRFHDPDLQELWVRVSHEGGRQVLKGANGPNETIRIMGRT
ncbi:putative methyltransferase type 11 [Diaporthe ampelina]|uniref:Putative methyltransferase type 11 n=1 Tax=Diaporthe ampelina TaxID=1214573 RepID=A0A0G2FCW0_9PEZI|nr:putative methyltransferase type 11 [Diaporthe ampelina]